jgi:hypothetical protein
MNEISNMNNNILSPKLYKINTSNTIELQCCELPPL